LSSDVISIRIPRELREKMKRFNIDWSAEIRRFIEERVKLLELAEFVRELEVKARGRRVKVDSTLLIREARYEG
jgi:uncharacterized protein with von Willebrand factor type A (vWA) domain